MVKEIEPKEPLKAPSTSAEALRWLAKLNSDLSKAKADFDEASKAVAEKFDLSVSDIKAGLKARENDNASTVIQKLNDRIDTIEEIAAIDQ